MTRDVQEVLAADARRIAALLAGDIPLLTLLTAEDYSHVETDGNVRGRDEFFALISRPGFRFVSWVVEENFVRVYGETAVVTGRYRNVVELPGLGVQPEKRARHLRVWVREDGAWRNVAHQATRITAG